MLPLTVTKAFGALKFELFELEFETSFLFTICHGMSCYESLNANLRPVPLTQVPKQFSHPKISTIYHANSIYLLCECYESLNANLRLVFLTRVSEQKFDP